MFEISIGKIFVIFIVALMVLGPEKATNVARLLGYWIGKIKRDLNQLKYELDNEKSFNINGTIKEIKKEFEVFKEAESNLKEGFNAFNESFNDYKIEHNPHLFEKIEVKKPNKRKMKSSFYLGSKTSSVGKRRKKKKEVKSF